VQQGCRDAPSADLAILHVDLTRTPADYRALAAGYSATVNGEVHDISKRRVSDCLLGEGDDYDGPVIVKSDLNHGGMSERNLRRAAGGAWRAKLADLAERWPTPWRSGPLQGDYRLFERRQQVPRWVWRHPGLVVEPFYVERRGPLFALNQWLFLGEAGIVSTLLAPTPLVKMVSVTAAVPLHDEVPEAIRRRRRELGFDYGKFDYVIHDGEARLLDANATPHRGPDAAYEARVQECIGIMASGLEGWLPTIKP
jgi:hypothetical protein